MLTLLSTPPAVHAPEEPRLHSAARPVEAGTAFDWHELQPIFCAAVLPILPAPYSTELTAEYIRTFRGRIRELMRQENPRCFYCARKLTGKRLGNLDHVVPISRGGSHFHTNLRLSCVICNRIKGALMPQELLEVMEAAAERLRQTLKEAA